MKKLNTKHYLLAFALLSLGFMLTAQPYIAHWHAPGFHTCSTKYKADEKSETLKQGFTGVSLSGFAWTKTMIIKTDVSYILYSLMSGFKAPKKFTGGVFEFAAGGTLMKRETSLLGASFDIIWRNAKNQHLLETYLGVGPTVYYSKAIGDHYYLMPSLTLAYSNAGVFGEFGLSQSYVFGDKWGLNMDLKFWNVNMKNSDASYGASNLKIGVAIKLH